MKAILIMDMPNCCDDCFCGYTGPDGFICIPKDKYFDGKDCETERAVWCPLRELPERKPIGGGSIIMRNEEITVEIAMQEVNNYGFNTCLDEIEGE